SAVVMYWDDRPLGPGARREVGFAYGLGDVVSDGAGRLLLSAAGQFVPGGEFTLTAQVKDPLPEERLTLTLPDGFELLAGGDRVQAVPPVAADATRQISVVTWRIRAGAAGKHRLKVDSSAKGSQTQP